jgi:hypothetical protein
MKNCTVWHSSPYIHLFYVFNLNIVENNENVSLNVVACLSSRCLLSHALINYVMKITKLSKSQPEIQKKKQKKRRRSQKF